jgi:hypothetical protein
MASLSGEQLGLLGGDEASAAVRLAQLTCNGFPASNGKPEDKEGKAKEKKAAKDSRKAAAQGRKVLEHVSFSARSSWFIERD